MRSFSVTVGPWQFLKKLFQRVQDNAVGDRAAQLAYYFLFALFPFLGFLVTLAAYLPVKGTMEDLLARLDQIMPAQAYEIIRGQLTQLTTEQRPHLLTVGLALALWGASRGVDALRSALNLSYDVKESRPFWKTNGIALLVTVVGSALMLLSIAGLALGGQVGFWIADHLGLDRFWPMVWAWMRWPITAILIMFFLALLYYFLPDVEQEWRFITPGSVVGTALWLGATWAFTYYAENFGTYQKTYGSIGGVIVLMTWLWISGYIFILGGEINALLEHSSVEGKARGARAADLPPEEPPEARPSAAAPGATKKASSAERTKERFWRRLRRSGRAEPSPPADAHH